MLTGGITKNTIWKISIENLGKRKYFAHFFPNELNEDQKGGRFFDEKMGFCDLFYICTIETKHETNIL